MSGLPGCEVEHAAWHDFVRVMRCQGAGRARPFRAGATGERAHRHEPSTVSQLTPLELQVARFVGQGLSNRQVAARLFVSPRTVDAHLRRVLAKLESRHAPSSPACSSAPKIHRSNPGRNAERRRMRGLRAAAHRDGSGRGRQRDPAHRCLVTGASQRDCKDRMQRRTYRAGDLGAG